MRFYPDYDEIEKGFQEHLKSPHSNGHGKPEDILNWIKDEMRDAYTRGYADGVHAIQEQAKALADSSEEPKAEGKKSLLFP